MSIFFDNRYIIKGMQIIELAAKLQSLGLTDKQSRVYVAALFLGAASALKISGQAETNRATTYVILDELIEMGVVSQSIEDNKTVFIAEGADALERWLGRQERDLAARKVELKSVAGELVAGSGRTAGAGPQVRFFHGIDGVAQMNGYFRRKAKPGSSVYGMSNIDEVKRLVPDVLSSNPAARHKKAISSKLLYSYEHGNLGSGKDKDRAQKRLTASVPADVNLYENGLTLSTYGANGAIGVVVESPEIASALRQLFDLAWDSLPEEYQK